MENSSMKKTFTSLREFYPYYLTEHQNVTSRTLHFVGTALLLCILAYALLTARFSWLWAVPLTGYGFAWVGHFFFEKNKPATFTYPLWSLASDFIMFWHILTGQLPAKMREALKN
jgi:hypothetical protein